MTQKPTLRAELYAHVMRLLIPYPRGLCLKQILVYRCSAFSEPPRGGTGFSN